MKTEFEVIYFCPYNFFLSFFFFFYQWESVGNLNKLPVLENLVMSYDEKTDAYFQEFAFARISSLMVSVDITSKLEENI